MGWVGPLVPRAVPGDCTEYLLLYDSHWPDPSAVIRAFCNGFSQPQEHTDYISTSNSLLVTFISVSGSYSGSSIYYWAVYSFHEARADGRRLEGSVCDEIIQQPGKFRSPRNTLVYKSGRDVACTYHLAAPAARFARLALRVDPVDFGRVSGSCERGCAGNTALDRVEVVEVVEGANVTHACLSGCQAPRPTTVTSLGPALTLTLHLVGATAPSLYYSRKPPLFTAALSYLHPPICGPTTLAGLVPGDLTFPHLTREAGQQYREVDCQWEVATRPGAALTLTISNVSLATTDCGRHKLAIYRQGAEGEELLHAECGQSAAGREVPVPGVEGSSSLTLSLHMASLGLGSIQLSWTYP